jgi:tetratricopeptide (TPR) repeat protein
MPAAGETSEDGMLDEYELGTEYKADYVLRGRVNHHNDSLHVVCNLFDLSAKNVTWSQTFERKVADIFGLQQELSERAAHAMKITLSQRDLEELATRPTISPAAYAYYLRGREYFARHYEVNYNFAIALYKKALQIDPDYALTYAGLGEVYLALYDWYMKREASIVDTAESYIKKALAIDPNLPEAHAAYGDLHRLRGADKIPQAIAEYLIAIRLNPNQAVALFHLTRLHRESGNFAEAAIWGKKCLQIQPMNAEACIEMALISWFQGFREEATRYFDRAIEMEPDHPISYGQKAFFAFCSGQWDQAKSLYERNLELDPRSSQALGALARIAFSDGQIDRAISLYKQLMQIGADGIDYFNLGQIHLSRGDFAAARACRDSALAVSQRLAQKNPRDHRWLSDLAIAYAVKGNAAMALKYITQAKQTRDFQANFIRKNRVLLREAMVFSLLGKNEQALAILRQLLSLHMYAPEYLRSYIGLENVRRDPRFVKLLDTG